MSGVALNLGSLSRYGGRINSLSRTIISAAVQALWSPLAWFSSGEQGLWYDPSDLSTMFQDSAGTTPVTAVEQPVGRILDKSGRGNHAFQATSTARPTLRARYNLLWFSEQFDNSFWAGGGSSATATRNAGVAPDGSTTANKLIPPASASPGHRATGNIAVVSGSSYTLQIRAKAAEYPRFGMRWYNGSAYVFHFTVDLNTGSLVSNIGQVTPTVSSLGSGWYLISITFIPTVAYMSITIEAHNATTVAQQDFVGDGTSGILIWGASMVTAADASLPYQRIAAATDYDADPAKFYAPMSFDGSDDSLAATAGGGGTTGGTWVFGIRLGALGAARTIWSDAGTNTGYRLRINSSNQVVFEAGDGSAYTSATVSTALTLGQRCVVTAWHDGTTLRVQVDNGTIATAAMGTVTAGTAAHTIGKANGAASEFFLGYIYGGLYVRDQAKSDLAAAKTYMGAKLGVTL